MTDWSLYWYDLLRFDVVNDNDIPALFGHTSYSGMLGSYYEV